MAAAGYTIPARRSVWLHGASADLLLGAGLGYLLSLPLLAVIGAGLGFQYWPIELTLLLGLAFSTPHYGATLLRVYEQREDRHRYAFFAVYASLALAALYAAALFQPFLGSFLVTLYFSWSPWHFAGQNYGLSLMFLRRRGVEVSAGAKRGLYTAFALSFLLTLIVFHTQDSVSAFAPDFSTSERHYDILRLGIPLAVTSLLVPLLALGFLLALGVAGSQLRRRGAGALDLLPAGLLALTQVLWFSVPSYWAMRGWPLEGLAFTAVWASTAHSIQYLWVTSYYARETERDRSLLPYYGKALLAGCLIGVLPALVAASFLVGRMSWTGGLAILTFSVVNLHHFVLDGAIWKLRDGRVARVLLRSRPASEAPREAAAAPRRWRSLVWALGIACLAVPVLEIWDAHAVRSDDLARVEAASRRLALIRRERVSVLGTLGDLLAARGERASAESAYRRALALRRDQAVLNNLAWMLAVQGPRERADEAVALAEEAVRGYGDDDYGALDTLAAAYAAAGRYADASRVAGRAVALARADADASATRIQTRLALYDRGRPYRVEPGASAADAAAAELP